jgi:hypothetical protein
VEVPKSATIAGAPNSSFAATALTIRVVLDRDPGADAGADDE